MDDHNVSRPLPAGLPGETGLGVGNECGEAVEIAVEGLGVDLCIALVRLGEGPKVQAEGQVAGGQQVSGGHSPQGLAQLFLGV
ncbi:hypothetical protein D9M72_580620 [compost metagenome]